MEENKQEKIDVLMAVYNPNITFLTKQIDSILSQSYENINLIISDDSSDNEDVKQVLNEYANKDNRIILYFQEENLGYLRNFEFLLTKSTAEYISYADQDDIWYENKIERSIKVLKEKDVDLVYSDCKQIDENGQVLHESYLYYKSYPRVNGKENILTFSRHFAIGCACIFTKKIKEQMLPFTENVMAHDWIDVYLASKQKGIACIEEQLFEYRLHGSNAFGGRNLKQNLSTWKQKNGKSYSAYKKYRNERVIKKAYLDGSLMCLEYRDKLNLSKNEDEEGVIDYYNQLLKTKILNIHLSKYNKYLAYKNIGKRRIKEEGIFHFPLISYLLYLIK